MSEAHSILRDNADGRGQRRFWGRCEVHGKSWSDTASGRCLACAHVPRVVERRAPTLRPCPLHGPQRIWGNTHGMCRQCYDRSGRLRPGLPLAKAPARWWARHEAHEAGAPGYMADCELHLFTEHHTRLGVCLLCRAGEPLRLRPK